MINSIEFWLTLAVAVIVYWRLPTNYRLPFLAVVSGAYIVYLDPLSAAILFACSLGIKWIFDRDIESGNIRLAVRSIVVGLILILSWPVGVLLWIGIHPFVRIRCSPTI